MMKHRMLKWIAGLAAAMGLAAPAAAEDIDLFMGATPSSTSAVPNVLIIFDNTANWNTAFTTEKAALISVFNGLPANKFKVGLMMFTETGGGNSGNDGAYVRMAIRLMTNDDASAGTTGTKTRYAAVINSLDVGNDKSNGGKIGKSMWEAHQYFSGGAPHAGNNKNKTDYTNNTDGYAADDIVHALSGNALTAKAGSPYQTPVDSTSCAKNYIIYISNGAAQDNTSDTTASKAALAALGGNTTTISLNPSGSQDNVADEWARYMKKSSLGVTTYTVDIAKVTTGQGPGWTALLKSMAGQSGGKYYDIGASDLANTLNNIFSEIQSVNSVFASVSLPISVNTQGTFLNQVYVGMFRPDSDSYPRWAGNLKQYKIGISSGALKLQDADSNPAINNITGFITECARSFWTPTSVDTDFNSKPQGDCITVSNSDISNYPDGNVVEKGAQAYKLRGTSTRTVKTCNNSTCTSMVTFNSTYATQTALGASSTTERDTIIDWTIGKDTADEDIDSVTTTERRLSIHGDVVHSRPVAVNFGSDASPKVMVFYGANDGMLRAINGNRTDDIGTVAAGQEAWSFMPNEFLSKIKRIWNNAAGNTSQLISFPTSTAGTAKDYGMDGPIAAFKGSVGGTQKVFVYGTMRRGGRSIYAFDVTDAATNPTAPTFKWRIGCSASGDCSTDMDGIGQTWAPIKTITHANYSSGGSPLLIFGGGYDTCEDTDGGSGGANHSCSGSSKGHYIYVVDANSGSLVKTFDTGGNRGIIGEIVVATDDSGHAKYGWASDLGGNVYRITFQGAASAWTMKKIASLGCDTTASCTAPRKFMFEPSVIDNGDQTYTLYLGSGDREKPVTAYGASNNVTNYFFQLKDKPEVASSEFPGNGCGSEIICLASLLPIAQNVTPTQADVDAYPAGWYLALSAKEQVVTAAITIFGVVTFSTHTPAVSAANSCTSNLGTTKVYNIDYKFASSANGTSSIWEDVSGDGLPPSAVAGQVTLDNGTTVPFCIGCSPDSPLEAVQKSGGGVSSRPKNRLYWYIEK